jgi:hypothetical protein
MRRRGDRLMPESGSFRKENIDFRFDSRIQRCDSAIEAKDAGKGRIVNSHGMKRHESKQRISHHVTRQVESANPSDCGREFLG